MYHALNLFSSVVYIHFLNINRNVYATIRPVNYLYFVVSLKGHKTQ